MLGIARDRFEEQAQSYLNMESAADMATSAEKKAATGADMAAGFNFAAGLVTHSRAAWEGMRRNRARSLVPTGLARPVTAQGRQAGYTEVSLPSPEG
jgi:hypothetical protein